LSLKQYNGIHEQISPFPEVCLEVPPHHITFPKFSKTYYYASN